MNNISIFNKLRRSLHQLCLRRLVVLSRSVSEINEVVVIHKEFPMKLFVEIDGCVVDGFDLEVIME